MKNLLVFAALLICTATYAVPKKNTSADLTKSANIFIGWIDISSNDWGKLGYENEQAWSKIIEAGNQNFQSTCKSKLPSRQFVGAKDRSDENTSGQDLYIKFSDARFDPDSYAIYVSIHFIDIKTGFELGSIPVRSYRGGHFSISSCMNGAFEKITDKIKEEIGKAKN